VLVEPYPVFLEALERLVEAIDITAVGATTSPAEALGIIRQTSPDLLMASINARDGDFDTLALVREVRSTPGLPTRVVVLGELADDQLAIAALNAGASAYLAKTADADDVAHAVRQTFHHSLYLASSQLRLQAVSSPANDASQLTRRESEILRLVAEGMSNAQIAQMLWVTEQTIKFHLSNVYRKLHVSNRTEASRWAQLNGLLDQQQPLMRASGDG
jgi:DNA-binding NarL/FixJ family response regulator